MLAQCSKGKFLSNHPSNLHAHLCPPRIAMCGNRNFRTSLIFIPAENSSRVASGCSKGEISAALGGKIRLASLTKSESRIGSLKTAKPPGFSSRTFPLKPDQDRDGPKWRLRTRRRRTPTLNRCHDRSRHANPFQPRASDTCFSPAQSTPVKYQFQPFGLRAMLVKRSSLLLRTQNPIPACQQMSPRRK